MKKKRILVFGVGVNDYIHSISDDGKVIKSYKCWSHMLERCYSAKKQLKYPTYIGCTVCDKWLIFSNFKEWYDTNYKEEFELDKDILVEGNKVYSPDTCCFVPKNINSLIHKNKKDTTLPTGVCEHLCIKNGKEYRYYRSSVYNLETKIMSPTFKTIEEAQSWYSATKKRVVAEQVQRALDEGAIDKRIADALMARNFC